MDINTNITESDFKQKTPIDLRIVVYITYTLGFYLLVVNALLLTPVARLGENGWTILFGTVTLSTKLYCAIYGSIFGFLHLICARGLMKRLKLAWWAILIIKIYELPNTSFSYPKTQIVFALIWTFINVTIIIWLLLRRKLFIKKLTNMQREVA
jgi:lysylphosphatidylglycerol synthetase-like protein (DUF2156 family)